MKLERGEVTEYICGIGEALAGFGSMTFDVFISYPHQDKATADAACAMLEAEGIRCWIAPRDVSPGAVWAAAIIDAIDHCRAMVLIFSSSTNGSIQIHREVQRAFDKEVPVVPFRIENVAPEASLAFFMGPVHWLDALTPPLEQHLKQLVTSVQAILRIEPPDRHPETEQMYLGIGSIAVCLIIILILIVNQLNTGLWVAVIFVLIGTSVSVALKTIPLIRRNEVNRGKK